MGEYFDEEEDDSEEENQPEDDESEEDDVEYLDPKQQNIKQIALLRNKLIHEFKIKRKDYDTKQGMYNHKLMGDKSNPDYVPLIEKFEFILNAPTLRQTLVNEKGKALLQLFNDAFYSWAKSIQYYKYVIKEQGVLFDTLISMYERDVKEIDTKQEDFVVTEEAYTWMSVHGRNLMADHIEAYVNQKHKKAQGYRQGFINSARSVMKNRPNADKYAEQLFTYYRNEYLKEYKKRKSEGRIKDIDSKSYIAEPNHPDSGTLMVSPEEEELGKTLTKKIKKSGESNGN